MKNIPIDKRPIGQMDILIEDLKRRGCIFNHVLDVGANRTKWSQLVSNYYPDAYFTLIEPQYEMEVHLKEFVQKNKGQFFLVGAGSANSKETLTIWDDLNGSSLLPSIQDDLERDGKQRTVEIKRIDDIIIENNLTPPDLVKLDIQGYEIEALKGASSIFGTTEVFIIEVSLFDFEGLPDIPLIYEVIQFMSSKGYVIYYFPGFLRRPFDGALGQCDVCFVKENGRLRKSRNWN